MNINLFIFSQNFESFKSKWCINSERILKYELINSSTTKIYMKKVSHYVEAI